VINLLLGPQLAHCLLAVKNKDQQQLFSKKICDSKQNIRFFIIQSTDEKPKSFNSGEFSKKKSVKDNNKKFRDWTFIQISVTLTKEKKRILCPLF